MRCARSRSGLGGMKGGSGDALGMTQGDAPVGLARAVGTESYLSRIETWRRSDGRGAMDWFWCAPPDRGGAAAQHPLGAVGLTHSLLRGRGTSRAALRATHAMRTPPPRVCVLVTWARASFAARVVQDAAGAFQVQGRVSME